MLRRKIEKLLEGWKKKKDKLPLVVEGMRQVGKTTSIRMFAQKHYQTIYEINFFEHPELKAIFDGALDLDTILKNLSFAFPSIRFSEGSTLLFLDEIQDAPKARTSLKFLARDRRFDVIASGSLLGINYSEVPSFPVGYTESINMTGLDFEEYLWAIGIGEELIDVLRASFDHFSPVDPFIHDRMLMLFSEYIVVGGMPAVVASYAEHRDYNRVLSIQRSIVSDFRRDIAKYADPDEKTKIASIFSSLPRQLAKDYKKFQYSAVEKGSGARKYGGALFWLRDAGIVSFCNNLSRLELPLSGFKIENEFKVYLNDTGLLVSMYEDGTAARIISGELGIFKGAIYENIIAETLMKNGFPLFYFSPSSHLEIDFIISHSDALTLLEVKSGENTKSKSLKSTLGNPKYQIERAIRFSRRNVGKEEGIVSYPLYMAFMLESKASESLPSLFGDVVSQLRAYMKENDGK